MESISKLNQIERTYVSSLTGSSPASKCNGKTNSITRNTQQDIVKNSKQSSKKSSISHITLTKNDNKHYTKKTPERTAVNAFKR